MPYPIFFTTFDLQNFNQFVVMSISANLKDIKESLPAEVTLIAVSKNHTKELIMEAYDSGHRIFGENKVQELVEKYNDLPKDIEWHMIGHLQTNKVKYIAPFVGLIHSVDSLKLLKIIDNEASKNQRTIDCLLQLRIAKEETKFGMDYNSITALLNSNEFRELNNIKIRGLMGMATFTDDTGVVEKEFRYLADSFRQLKQAYFQDKAYFKELSMGMSDDYQVALRCGSTMIRVGSIIFGERNYNK